MRQSGIWLALVSALGFSTLAILSKINLEHGGNATMFLAMRFSLAAALLWAMLLVRRQVPSLRTMAVPAVMGLLGYVTMSYLFVSSTRYISASMSGILLYTYPAIVTIFSALVDRQRLPALRWLALGLATLGVLLVVGSQWAATSPVGIAMALAAAVVYSAYILAGGKLLDGITPLQTTATVCLTAAIFFVGMGLVQHAFVPVDATAWGAMVAVAIFPTVIAVLTFFAALERIGPGPAAIASSFEPVSTALLQFAIWGFAFTGWQVLGGVCVVLSVILLQLQARTVKKPVPASNL